ncbi:hypothetical protein JAAARDRAFT_31885 [Jaapia argillacea MUCL 33604]|uniref:F-box domain-containing protein n=1 Tax=Jaapia argillacea MUCL 33604 TaxID=933084 RepID=A0A067Q1D6_9AGAM|nr:hypothetical protein JAAARDRAFT_31885 [Jaapia argillacea MUCL 33604]
MMERRSARLRNKSQTQGQPLSQPAHEDNKEESDVSLPRPHPGKRRRRGSLEAIPPPAPVVPRRRGAKLSQLPDMPLDILFEIFSNLTPYDLLRLSRATKALRDILLRPSAKSIWIDAFAGVQGLPPCPPDLTEPQYAHLAFDIFCDFCGAPNVKSIMWACRVKTCTNCITHRFTSNPRPDNLPPALANKVIPYGELLPFSRRKRRSGIYIYQCGPLLYRNKHVEAIKVELLAVISDEVRLNEFIAKGKALVEEKIKHAQLCEKWDNDRGLGRLRELKDIRQSRKEAIENKLREEGYGTELDEMDFRQQRAFDGHPSVKPSKFLTERGWASIKDGMIEFMELIRVERLQRLRKEQLKCRERIATKLLEEYLLTIPATQICPGSSSLVFMEPFRTIITSPSDVDVTPESFSDAKAQLPSLVAEWRQSVNQELLALFQSEPSKKPKSKKSKSKSKSKPTHSTVVITPEDESKLSLATTFFTCSNCTHEVIDYERATAHECMSKYYRVRECMDHDPETRDLIEDLRIAPWTTAGNPLSISQRDSTFAAVLLQLCGKDPAVTTAAEMEELDPRFECTHCTNKHIPGGHHLMTWHCAIYHCRHGCAAGNATNFKLADEETTAKCKALEAAQNFWQRAYQCTTCKMALHPQSINNHMSDSHGIQEVMRSHYRRAADGSIGRFPPAVQLPRPAPSIPLAEEGEST